MFETKAVFFKLWSLSETWKSEPFMFEIDHKLFQKQKQDKKVVRKQNFIFH